MTTLPIQGSRALSTARSLGTSYRKRARYDWVAVDLLVDGGCHRGEVSWNRVTDADKTEAIRRLARAGLTDPQIADRIGINDRTVLRIRSAHRIASATPTGVNGKALVR